MGRWDGEEGQGFGGFVVSEEPAQADENRLAPALTFLVTHMKSSSGRKGCFKMSYFSHFVLFLSFSFFSCFNLASVCLKAYRPWRQKKPFGSQFQFVGFSPTQTHGWIFIPRLLHCGPLQRSTFSRPTGGARVRLSSAELTT